jgi:hypothetical protein
MQLDFTGSRKGRVVQQIAIPNAIEGGMKNLL